MAYQSIIPGSIVVGQSESNIFQLNEATAVGVTISGSVLTGTTLSFLVSDRGTDFYPLYDDEGTEITVTAGSSARCLSLNPNHFFPWNFVKCRLGTSASPVNQASYDVPLTINSKIL
jgi:hypothetical protein